MIINFTIISKMGTSSQYTDLNIVGVIGGLRFLIAKIFILYCSQTRQTLINLQGHKM